MTVAEIRQHAGFRWHCGCLPRPPQPPQPPIARTQKPRNQGNLHKPAKILQLNIDGWRGKATILTKLTEETGADIVALQETKLTAKDASPTDWTVYRADRTAHRTQSTRAIAQGGVALIVRPGLDTKPLPALQLPHGSALESVGASIRLGGKWVDIWSIYRPPARGGASDARDAALHTPAWPTNAIICSDINAHGAWDASKDSDEYGTQLEDWMTDKGLLTLNSGAPTRFDSHGRGSSPDVTIVPTNMSQDMSWEVLGTIGSDHAPIAVTLGRDIDTGRGAAARINIRKADWDAYGAEVRALLDAATEQHSSIEKENKELVRIIQTASKRSIPVTTRKGVKPWWNGECEAAKKACNAALNKLRRDNTEANRHDYATRRQALHTAVQSGKQEAWRDFVSTLNPRTPTTKVWNTLRAMDGRKKSRLPNVPISDNKLLTSDQQKADRAAAVYASVSRVPIPREDQKAAYTSYRKASKQEHPELDALFTRRELNEVLCHTKPTAAGPDGIHPLMLRNLPEEGKERLLRLINRSWTEGRVPAQWKTACIIPILKKN